MEENKKPNNPFAFPYSGNNGYKQDGMTLRDYFANSAMQAMISNSSMFDNLSGNASELVSKWSYEIADSMLKIREESQK